jgi:hypothetical protein
LAVEILWRRALLKLELRRMVMVARIVNKKFILRIPTALQTAQKEKQILRNIKKYFGVVSKG